MMIPWICTAVGWLCGWELLLGTRKLANPTEDEYTHLPAPSGSTTTSLSNATRGTASSSGISVIIPARNEARNIGPLLQSLAAQSLPSAEIIVADDGSVDGTAAIAAAAGAKVISPGDLPPGWMGKSWACWNGAHASTGERLIFLDADITLSPRALERIQHALLTGDDALSVQPWHRTVRAYEQLSAFLNAVVLASVGGRGRKAAAFGPCFACAREDYLNLGGHESVRMKLLDHHALGRQFAEAGYRVGRYAGKGTVYFRMYPDGLRALITGWSKSFASGAASTSLGRLAAVSLWIGGAVTVVVQSLAAAGSRPSVGIQIAWAVAYLTYAVNLYVHYRRAGNFGMRSALLFPVTLAMMLFLFVGSMFQTFVLRRVTWKGRTLSAEDSGELLK